MSRTLIIVFNTDQGKPKQPNFHLFPCQDNKRLYLQLLDIELGACPVSEEKVEEVFDLVKNSELDTEVKQGFSQRRIEFLEDFSVDINKIMVAQENHSKLYKGKSALIPLSGRKRSQELDR